MGAANIEGGAFFHVASGNLGYQVEHHLFPDMPSSRYAEIAPRVKAICERYGLPYNIGPFSQQLGMVQRTILRLAFPGRLAAAQAGPVPRGRRRRVGLGGRAQRPSCRGGRGGVVSAASTSRRRRDGHHGGSEPGSG